MVLPATYPPPAQWAVGGAAPLPRTVSARSWRRQRATGWGERGAAARGNAAALWGAALLLFRRRSFGALIQMLMREAAGRQRRPVRSLLHGHVPPYPQKPLTMWYGVPSGLRALRNEALIGL